MQRYSNEPDRPTKRNRAYNKPPRGKNEPTANPFKAFLTDVMSRGGWTALSWSCTTAVGYRNIVVLMHLLSLSQFRADARGWIDYTDKYAANGLGIKPEALTKVLLRPFRLAVVELERPFDGRRRKVRVDLPALTDLIDRCGPPAWQRDGGES
jgi:hypothetical protein